MYLEGKGKTRFVLCLILPSRFPLVENITTHCSAQNATNLYILYFKVTLETICTEFDTPIQVPIGGEHNNSLQCLERNKSVHFVYQGNARNKICPECDTPIQVEHNNSLQCLERNKSVRFVYQGNARNKICPESDTPIQVSIGGEHKNSLQCFERNKSVDF